MDICKRFSNPCINKFKNFNFKKTDDGYPIISGTGISYADNDPKPPSATTNFISDFYGRVPYDPDFHKQIRGTLTIGYGTTFDGKPGKQDLFNQVYTDGISIGGATYIFPVQF